MSANPVDQVLANNQQYQSSHHVVTEKTPRMLLAVVRCMDHRINTSDVLGISAGDADEIANAGASVTDDVLRSLAVSQRKKGTRAIVVIGHSDCGMTSFSDEAMKTQIRDEIGEAPDYSFGTFPDVTEHIRKQVELIRACPYLPHRDMVRGFVLDLKTGELRDVELAHSVAELQ